MDRELRMKCTGCTACVNVCPHSAIEMIEDRMGFLYPKVSQQLCVKCGLCVKVCPANALTVNTLLPPPSHAHVRRGTSCTHSDASQQECRVYQPLTSQLIYGGRLKDRKEVVRSQSGGIVYQIAKKVLSCEGIVYGAANVTPNKVEHIRISNPSELDQIRGSKYIQSNLGRIFTDVINDLKQGKKVLFTGTGCQSAGLRSLIKIKGIEDTNLFICDIICHGVGSPRVWSDNVSYIEEKYGGCKGKKEYRHRVQRVEFRSKEFTNCSKSFYTLDNNQVVKSALFLSAYYDGLINRWSCGNCQYCSFNRVGDVTAGDFYGIIATDKTKFHDEIGTSLILVNTQKGRKLFKSIEKEIDYFESNRHDAIQPHLVRSSKASYNRENFEEVYSQRGFIYAMSRYGALTLKNRVKILMKDVVNVVIKKCLPGWWNQRTIKLMRIQIESLNKKYNQ